MTPSRGLICVGTRRDEAFTSFYRSHWPAVAGYCAGIVRSSHVGEVLAQEAFARLYGRWGTPRDPVAYVFRIAHNLAIDHIDRARRQDVVEADDVHPAADCGLLDAVRRLPPALRDVTFLHYYADLTAATVAHLLRRPLGTVKRQLHEARGQLALDLKESHD